MPPKSKKTSTVIPETMTALRDQLEKRYGTGRVVRREEVMEYDVISTGSLTLDYATRVGGIVRGRTHEIVGPEGVGKTTLTINAMVEAQRAYPDLAVGYIDMEQTFDYDWAESLGLDTSKERWFHIYPDDSEDVSDQLRMLCRTDLFSIVAVDSIGGMESKKALSREAEDVDMGNNAKVITRMVKNVAVLAARHNVGIIFINQLRANLSGMGQDISAGPKALRYNTTMKIDMRQASGDRDQVMVEMKFDGEPDPIQIGVKIKCKVVRNKVGPKGYVGEFWIFNHDTDEYGPVGIDRVGEAVSIGVRLGIINQGGGGQYTLPDGRKVRGKAALVDLLREELDVVDSIRTIALAQVSGEVVPDVAVSVEATDD